MRMGSLPALLGLGVLLAFIGEWLMGYAAAVAIPKAYFAWFEDFGQNALALFFIGLARWIVSYTIVALAAGWIIGKYFTRHWLSGALVCYLASQAYAYRYAVSVQQQSLVISNPFSGMPFDSYWHQWLPALFLPLCLLLAARRVAQKYRKPEIV